MSNRTSGPSGGPGGRRLTVGPRFAAKATERATAKPGRGTDDGVSGAAKKINKHIKDKFENDHEKAWKHYAGNDGKLQKRELRNFLDKVDLGPRLFRGVITNGVINYMDVSPKDGSVTLRELAAAAKKKGIKLPKPGE